MNVVNLRPNSVAGDEARVRQDCVDDARRALQDASTGINHFPQFLQECLEREVWKHERLISQTTLEPCSFTDFITKPSPTGLDASFEVVERFIGTDPVLLALWQRHSRRGDGGQQGNRNAAKEETTVDNVHGRFEAEERPTGNTAAAGMRRLQKEADAGNEAAQAEYGAVLSGERSINAACVAMGWRANPADKKAAVFQLVGWFVSNAPDDAHRLTDLLARTGAPGARQALHDIQSGGCDRD